MERQPGRRQTKRHKPKKRYRKRKQTADVPTLGYKCRLCDDTTAVRAFGINEILDHIAFYLAPRDYFSLARACRGHAVYLFDPTTLRVHLLATLAARPICGTRSAADWVNEADCDCPSLHTGCLPPAWRSAVALLSRPCYTHALCMIEKTRSNHRLKTRLFTSEAQAMGDLTDRARRRLHLYKDLVHDDELTFRALLANALVRLGLSEPPTSDIAESRRAAINVARKHYKMDVPTPALEFKLMDAVIGSVRCMLGCYTWPSHWSARKDSDAVLVSKLAFDLNLHDSRPPRENEPYNGRSRQQVMDRIIAHKGYHDAGYDEVNYFWVIPLDASGSFIDADLGDYYTRDFLQILYSECSVYC